MSLAALSAGTCSQSGKVRSPGGNIVLSGILREQADDVLSAYEAFFEMDAPVVRDEWVLLHGCRSS